MTFQKAIGRIETIAEKEVSKITRVGIRGGRDIYAIEFNDGSESDFYIDLNIGCVEKVNLEV